MDREELKKDEASVIAQIQQLQGMLSYIRAKLTELDKKEKQQCTPPSSEPSSTL